MDSAPGTTEVTETIRPATPATGATVGGDNDFPIENLVLLHPPLVAEPGHKDGTAAHNPGASQMRDPKPFTSPARPAKPLFTVHAYSLEQARAIVAAKVAGETIVIGPVARDGGSR